MGNLNIENNKYLSNLPLYPECASIPLNTGKRVYPTFVLEKVNSLSWFPFVFITNLNLIKLIVPIQIKSEVFSSFLWY